MPGLQAKTSLDQLFGPSRVLSEECSHPPLQFVSALGLPGKALVLLRFHNGFGASIWSDLGMIDLGLGCPFIWCHTSPVPRLRFPDPLPPPPQAHVCVLSCPSRPPQVWLLLRTVPFFPFTWGTATQSSNISFDATSYRVGVPDARSSRPLQTCAACTPAVAHRLPSRQRQKGT